ncbi:MAG: indole-3-glycerol phosphate synthase TrpC [Candidatus Flemingibacterium sp.]|nr:indole-3-glycerol phosphate synthase TrpC [Candidatus Flemingibacterium sp.]
MTILDKLAASTKARCEAAKGKIPPEEIRRLAENTPKGDFGFEKALKKPGMSFICECKRASPSKGLIAPEFPYLDIARDYEAAGADCVSVLTEPEWFLGSDRYLEEIAHTVGIPCLRKDFTVDEYMIYEAKLLGASAVLFICSILDAEQLKEYIGVADSLGLSSLVEAHDEREIAAAVGAGARVIGVNNRNLKDFTVDTGNSGKLRSLVPDDIVFVSESGVSDAGDVKRLYDAHVDAVLIGEALMRASDRKAKLAELRSLI